MHIQGIEDRALTARITQVHPLPGLRAGSALLRVGQRLLAVQDDAYAVAWITLPGPAIEHWVLKGDGAALPKKEKPDFEAAVAAHEAVYLIGSGSKDNRREVARIDAGDGTVKLHERKALYRCLREAMPEADKVNIEGACVQGGRLRLFQRGAGGEASAMIELPLEVLEGAEPQVLDLHWFVLGALDGVALAFTDAACVEGGTMFTATAEFAKDAVADGPVAGSAIGLLAETRGGWTARWARIVEADGSPTARKVEGLVADDDLCGAWVLTDPDDPLRPAELCRVELSGYA